jgi:hypothetical protein
MKATTGPLANFLYYLSTQLIAKENNSTQQFRAFMWVDIRPQISTFTVFWE